MTTIALNRQVSQTTPRDARSIQWKLEDRARQVEHAAYLNEEPVPEERNGVIFFRTRKQEGTPLG